jgi:hypothetical protein
MNILPQRPQCYRTKSGDGQHERRIVSDWRTDKAWAVGYECRIQGPYGRRCLGVNTRIAGLELDPQPWVSPGYQIWNLSVLSPHASALLLFLGKVCLASRFPAAVCAGTEKFD